MEKINLKDYSLDELRELIRLIEKEKDSRQASEKSLKVIELKMKYEGRWLCDENDDLYYIKEIKDYYNPYSLENTTALTISSWGNEFYVSLISMQAETLDRYNLLDADEVGVRIAEFKGKLRDFIERETK